MEDMIKVKMKPLPLRILQSKRGYNVYKSNNGVNVKRTMTGMETYLLM